MSKLPVELRDAHEQLQAFLRTADDPSITKPLAALEEMANLVGKAWSGSWIGYHSNVYYNGFKTPPPGNHFSSEWGLDDDDGMGTQGDWKEYEFDSVKQMITKQAGEPDLAAAKNAAARGRSLYEEAEAQVTSILELANSDRQDAFLTKLLNEAQKVKAVTPAEYVEYCRPSGGYASRDSLAMSQGLWTPPHLAVLAEVVALRSPARACGALATIAQKAAAHLERIERDRTRAARLGTNVFIGHGRSLLWKDLKDFIQDRLDLPWDEFNRVPVAGVTNIARLSEMLDAATVAFVIMTAEDELIDGQIRARMNVIHEVGLFQGRLGFTKAIVLLEEGCEEFSNIQGLGQIRFPKGNIKAACEEIRQVLEREGILESARPSDV